MSKGHSENRIAFSTQAFMMLPLLGIALFVLCAIRHRQGRLRDCPRATCQAVGNMVSSICRLISSCLSPPPRQPARQASTHVTRPPAPRTMSVQTPSTISTSEAAPTADIWFTHSADGAPPTYAEYDNFDPVPPVQPGVLDTSVPPPPSYEEAVATDRQTTSPQLPKEAPPKYESVA